MPEDARVPVAACHPEAVQVAEVAQGVKLEAVARKAPVDDSLAVEHVPAGRRERVEREVLGVRLEHPEQGERTRPGEAP